MMPVEIRENNYEIGSIAAGFLGIPERERFRYIVSLEKEASRKLMELEERMDRRGKNSSGKRSGC